MLFYVPNLGNPILPDFTFDHLKSHQAKENEVFFATDFKGLKAKCKLTSWNKKDRQATFEIIHSALVENPLKNSLVQAIPDKFYLDKLVEIATLSQFAKIVLFQSKFSPKYNLNLERINKISLQAALLAEQTNLPSIEIVNFSEIQANTELIKNSYILHQHGELLLSYNNAGLTESEMNIWVGPEGGWSKEEEDWFNRSKLPKISLSKTAIYPAWLAGSVWKMKV